jgi:lipopolysaccharide transport system ATP-binding protein
MSDVVIRVENLGKRYRIGERERYLALRDVLTRAFSTPARLFGPRKSVSSSNGTGNGNGDHSHIWALKDVSFDIRQGEVVGIIGRNGAGKSTLLKILARVTKPTRGLAEIRGRMGTLLEVGTGFHPELTGRENVFLSGAILGMSKSEIRRKFDEIVDFAEVEKFIDTPLKHYSTGMQMRLAFAVAAHLEPEILLVDEVLSVGDIEFQKKCLGKMGDVAKGGRTILFVSHQMNQIRKLCQRVLWTDAGQIRSDGASTAIVSEYEAAARKVTADIQGRFGAVNYRAKFERWEILQLAGAEANVLDSHGPLSIRFVVHANQPLSNVHHGIALYDNDRRLLWGTATDGLRMGPGQNELKYNLTGLPLKPGAYSWRVTLYDDLGLLDDWDCTPDMLVTTTPVGHWIDEWAGLLNIPYSFTSDVSNSGLSNAPVYITPDNPVAR